MHKITDNLESFKTGIAKANKRFGAEVIQITNVVEGVYVYARYAEQSSYEVKEYLCLEKFNVDNPKHAGKKKYRAWSVEFINTYNELGVWRVIGQIDHMDYGNVLNVIDEHDREVLEKYREVGCNCDHCKVNRQRNTTYILHNPDKGFVQIGSTCVKDFTGIDPKKLFSVMKYFIDLSARDFYDPESNYGGCGGGTSLITPNEALAAIKAAIDAYGYKSTRQYEHNHTAGTAEGLLMSLSFSEERLAKCEPDFLTVRQAMIDNAPSMDELRLDILANLDRSNSFGHNVGLWLELEYIDFARFQISSIAGAMTRYLKIKEKEKFKATLKNEHIGNVKDKLQLNDVIVTYMLECNGTYGVTWMIIMLDSENRTLKWQASNPPEAFFDSYSEYRAVRDGLDGAELLRLNIKGTVKELSTYNGVAQTVLTRVKLI